MLMGLTLCVSQAHSRAPGLINLRSMDFNNNRHFLAGLFRAFNVLMGIGDVEHGRGSHRPDYTALSSGDLGGQAGVDFDPSTPPKLVPFSNQLEMVSGGVSGVGGWIGKAGKRPGAESSGGEGLKCLHH